MQCSQLLGTRAISEAIPIARMLASDRAKMAKEEAEKRLNPFQTLEHIPALEWVKLVIGATIVAPLRFLLVVVVVALGTLAMRCAILGVDVNKPLSPRRQRVQDVLGAFCGYLLAFLFGVHRIHVKGELASREKCKLLIASPHSTVMDATVLAAVCRAPSSVGKVETANSIVGEFLRACQTIFVDREDKNNRHWVAQQIRERADPNSDWKRHLLIFPEGTCTNRTSLISFRKGAFEPGAPVQPVLLHWDYHFFDPTWCAGAPSRTLIVLRTLSQVFHSVTVEFLPIYEPSKEEKEDALLFANNVRSKMAEKMGVPTSDHSYADMFLAQVAAKNKMKPAQVLDFTFEKLKEELGSSFDSSKLFETCKSLLICFAHVEGMSQDCLITNTQFETLMPILETTLDQTKIAPWPEKTALMNFHSFVLHVLRSR